MARVPPTNLFVDLSNADVRRLGRELQGETFHPQKTHIPLSNDGRTWLGELNIDERKALGQVLADKASPALVTEAEWSAQPALAALGNTYAAQLQDPDVVKRALLAINRVSIGTIKDHNDRSLSRVHAFLKKSYDDPTLVEPLPTIRTYLNPTSDDYDPSYRIDYIMAGGKIIGAAVTWSFTMPDGRPVRVIDYNTPLETGFPPGFEFVGSQLFEDQLSDLQPNEILMVEADEKMGEKYANLGFTQDPKPYRQLAVDDSEEKLDLYFFSATPQGISTADVLRAYVQTVEDRDTPDFQERLQSNLEARDGFILQLPGASPKH